MILEQSQQDSLLLQLKKLCRENKVYLLAAFAAIQFGASLVRANGKGIVAMYDYKGNTLARMNTITTDSQIVCAEIPIHSIKTVYSIIGDPFVFFWIIFLLIVIGLKIVPGRNPE